MFPSPQGGWSSSPSSNELSVLDGAALPRVVRVPCVTVSTPRFKYGFSATLMSMPDVSPITQVSTIRTCYCRRIISCTCSLSINISLYCTRSSTLTLTLTLSHTLTLPPPPPTHTHFCSLSHIQINSHTH